MIDIAVGSQRNTVTWKNKKFTWEQLAQKLSTTHRTAETYKEYMSASKDRQDAIKDIGGFVGGYLLEGRRKIDNLRHRQLITLDIDMGTSDFWDNFTMLYDCEALVYSTHKHSTKNPRLRLVMPINRPVSGEEYEAISRRLASTLGMDEFDPTTFQPTRLMYWPSTSSDGVFQYSDQNGDWLDADEVLDTYTNWQDISEWPTCTGENKTFNAQLKNQEDPTEKRGLIGAFCKAYSISAAIEKFIPDAYEAWGDDRYTYTDGTTFGGAIVYDDLFLFSHHSTDPVSGLLVNAFDLIRIHKFGHMDKNKDPDIAVTRLPSYGEMMTMIQSIGAVIKQLGEFSDIPEGDWLEDLTVTKLGAVQPTIDNLLTILRNDENLKGAFSYNMFDHREYVTKPLPWNPAGHLRQFTDKDDAKIRHYFEKHFKVFNANKTRDALDIVSDENGFHPVKEYLGKLAWDGIPRVESLFIEHLGAADTPYIRAVTTKALVAAIARIYQPGIKFDYVLTLIGPQGYGKSQILHELGREWYSDSMGSIKNKEAPEQIQGIWLLEIGELAGLKRAEVEEIKHFITKQTDRFRVAYARRAETFARQCVFFATTNEKGFLRDSTGNRRFWPVTVYKKYVHGSIDVAQVWAEAKHLYEKGEHLYLNKALEIDAVAVQREHAESDERVGVIESFLNMELPLTWNEMQIYDRRDYIAGNKFEHKKFVPRTHVSVAEIWCEALKGDFKDMTTFNTKQLHAVMQNMPGWELTNNKKYRIYGYQRTYKRVDDGEQGRAQVQKDFA